MVWKQDLAKLKQQLGPEAPAPKPQPKPAPKPERPASMDDEDAVFLSAMGLKPQPARPPKPDAALPTAEPPATLAQTPAQALAAPAQPTAQTPAPSPETFQEAIKDLKGFKPLAKGLPGSSTQPPKAQPFKPRTDSPVPAAPSLPALPPEPIPLPVPAAAVTPLASTEPEPLGLPAAPLRFQLAAGMAIEVDGTLDLRGHSLSDAMERLKDRLGDGTVLGWRSLQVTLGPDPVLHEGLLSLLASGETPMVTRYAQAPVPMGGTQAWLLYFGLPPVQP